MHRHVHQQLVQQHRAQYERVARDQRAARLARSALQDHVPRRPPK